MPLFIEVQFISNKVEQKCFPTVDNLRNLLLTPTIDTLRIDETLVGATDSRLFNRWLFGVRAAGATSLAQLHA